MMPTTTEVHCRRCGDAFEPDGYVGEDGAFCSDSCEEAEAYGRWVSEIYDQARYGGAPMF